MPGGLDKHSWNLTPSEAIRLQEQIRNRVIERPLNRPIRLVAGVDAALSADKDKIVAAAVLLRTDKPWLPDKPTGIGQSLTILEQQYAWADLSFPYIPGLLSFREAPAVLQALAKLRHQPDLVILDAQGQAHPRRAGLASHVGVVSGLPCVGCAKSRLTGHHTACGIEKGCCVDLLDKDGQLIGRVLRTRRAVKPVYVSVGHLVSLEQAAHAILAMTTSYRLPEPTRLAHSLAAKLRLHPPG
ncbi:MAG: endonuclease V [Actinobacteria bacterium]|nr:endonuclease V [Actinomycetota bacterium]